MRVFIKERALTPSWDLVRPSVALLRKNIWPTIYLSFLPILAMTVGSVMIDERNLRASIPGIIIVLVSIIWYFLTYPGFTYMQAKAARGKVLTPMESFKKGLPRFWQLIGMSLLSSLLIFVGLLAFIVPGLILLRAFYLAPYYVVDRKLGPIEALKRSYEDSKPVTGWIWGIIGVELVFGLIAGLFGRIPVIGYLFAIILSYPYIFAPALRYSEIVHKTKIPNVER
ncbi:MAG: hypothetical protein JWP13_517 [Candidatus Saccharibacteria bacterium]|nr:hypothetical protein [Candidatus Saccharibacteria bacterium]